VSDPARAPLVSFLVPCYRLAHLLSDCVGSILAQDFDDFEVLILDDCSPDNTPEVAASLTDPRVRHIRHPQNLGHLRNYNRGVELARGRYIWLISADDRLWRPYVLSRFVAALESHPDATFAFCPVRKFNDEGDTALHGSVGSEDAVWRGQDFFDHLLNGNIVPAPAALARRSAYEAAGCFPLDLPFAGDWYMWAAFAHQGDVIYMAEPMVKYRLHALNMTKTFLDRAAALVRDEVEVLWRLKGLVENSGNEWLRRRVVSAIGQKYALHVGRWAADGWTYGLDVDAFEHSLRSHDATPRERESIRRDTYAALGDGHFDAGRRGQARSAYVRSLSAGALNPKTLVKLALLGAGTSGARLRRALSSPGGLEPGDWISAGE
jgi:glycosyltransferase involved in cell wall biosynthesis